MPAYGGNEATRSTADGMGGLLGGGSGGPMNMAALMELMRDQMRGSSAEAIIPSLVKLFEGMDKFLGATMPGEAPVNGVEASEIDSSFIGSAAVEWTWDGTSLGKLVDSIQKREKWFGVQLAPFLQTLGNAVVLCLVALVDDKNSLITRILAAREDGMVAAALTGGLQTTPVPALEDKGDT